jgi:hypothetical protein
MDYTQTFEEFSKGLSKTDLALYAGIGIVLWVLFKEKLSPVAKIVQDLVNSFKSKVVATPIPKNPVPSLSDLTLVVSDGVKPVVSATSTASTNTNDLFFNLVTSWKQTRDLAVKSGCDQAVKVADQMFPYLSPTVCKENTDE